MATLMLMRSQDRTAFAPCKDILCITFGAPYCISQVQGAAGLLAI